MCKLEMTLNTYLLHADVALRNFDFRLGLAIVEYKNYLRGDLPVG